MGIRGAYDDGGLGLGRARVAQRVDVPQEHPQLHQCQRVPQDGLRNYNEMLACLKLFTA